MGDSNHIVEKEDIVIDWENYFCLEMCNCSFDLKSVENLTGVRMY